MHISLLAMMAPGILHAQEAAPDARREFVESLIDDSMTGETIAARCDSMELDLAGRFGIEYEGASWKCLIGNDIDPDVGSRLRNSGLRYSLTDGKIDDSLSVVTLTTADKSYAKKFYFRNGKFVGPLLALTSGWHVFTTRYFRFLVSDSSRYFRCTADSLDAFVDRMGSALRLPKSDLKTLAERKIIYALCTNIEIESIAGVPTRGLYLLAEDAVVSSYRYHIHELTHFLVNFKLRKLPLYTNPMLQEGFAVAMGGRGGLSADVVARMGAFLVKSGTMTPGELLKPPGFRSADASMTYAVAGLFNAFLIRSWGMRKYLKFVKSHSSSDPADAALEIDPAVLRTLNGWDNFVDNIVRTPAITIGAPVEPGGKQVIDTDSARVWRSKNALTFKIQAGLRLDSLPVSDLHRYVSTDEEVPGYRYFGEKYLVTASANEIRIYDRVLGMLIANYVPGFSLPAQEIQAENGYFGFKLRPLWNLVH